MAQWQPEMPHHWQCAGCGQGVPRSGYSSTQLKKGEARRCAGCVGSGEPTPAAANTSAKPAAATPKDDTGTLPCSNCAEEVETSGYSKNQRTKSERRRCKACVAALQAGGEDGSKQRKGGKGKGKGNGKGGGGGKGKRGGRSGKGGGGRGRGQIDDAVRSPSITTVLNRHEAGVKCVCVCVWLCVLG